MAKKGRKRPCTPSEHVGKPKGWRPTARIVAVCAKVDGIGLAPTAQFTALQRLEDKASLSFDGLSPAGFCRTINAKDNFQNLQTLFGGDNRLGNVAGDVHCILYDW